MLSLRGGTGGQLRSSLSPLGARDEQEGPSMAQAACDETHSDDSNADESAGKIAEKKQKPRGRYSNRRKPPSTLVRART